MIKASKILRMVRKKLNDNDEVKYSDYDVLDALNECIRYINVNYSMKNSDFLERIKRYRQDEMNAQIAAYNETASEEDQKSLVDFSSGVDLPADFLTLVNVIRASDNYHLSPVTAGEKVSYGGYKVFAGKIFCATDFTITYRAQLEPVNDLATDEINLPEIFMDMIVKISCMILQNNAETDVLMQEISRLTDGIVPARRYTNVKRRMPFLC